MTKELALEMVKLLFLNASHKNIDTQHHNKTITFNKEELQLLIRIIKSID